MACFLAQKFRFLAYISAHLKTPFVSLKMVTNIYIQDFQNRFKMLMYLTK